MLITEFPNEILGIFFDLTSLHDKLRLRAVCTRFRDVITLNGRMQKELFLFGMPGCFSKGYYDSMCLIADNDAMLPFRVSRSNTLSLYQTAPRPSVPYSEDGAAFIAELYPNLQKLHLMIPYIMPADDPDDDFKTPTFDFKNIAKWSESLTDLTLNMRMYQKIKPKKRPEIWSYVDQLTALKSLHVFNLNDNCLPNQLAIADQLEKLTLRSNGKIDLTEQTLAGVEHFLAQMGSSLTSLQTDMLPYNRQMTAARVAVTQLAGNIQELTLFGDDEHVATVVDKIFPSLTGVTKLNLVNMNGFPDHIRFSHFMHKLACLSQLETIRFEFDFLADMYIYAEYKAAKSRSAGGIVRQFNFPSMASVRHLIFKDRAFELRCNENDLEDDLMEEFHTLSFAFPCIEKITLLTTSHVFEPFDQVVIPPIKKYFGDYVDVVYEKYDTLETKMEALVTKEYYDRSWEQFARLHSS